MNLFLTEDGVLKLGYYGLTTQAECYSIKETDCDGVRSFAPEVFEEEYEAKSDAWSLGIALMEMMGLTPYVGYRNDQLPTMDGLLVLPFLGSAIELSELVDFLKKCFVNEVNDRWGVTELLNVRDAMENDE